ncbi:class I SAM-dependent methyltransferase [Ensifer adhaerens]|uniref:class I SAM-dependent methyltransferase n=1 Tax=Ensifer adhaerens TaxID=106592 RepID=UPI000FDB2534|nr:methyltransferase domain-containing protein [Ensifer adhaerens]MDF8358660.1 methyltransferase domain-containing protein [Ensifer adhaerens]THA59483.1 class I SAM-dependent methyltransferase [Ensifer adhaerens]
MIIHYRRPARDLPFDGERFTSAASGSIEHEHIHRYLFALQFCAGKRVLDIASGEGFGSALLAQASEYVVGIDIAEEAVQHAQANYGSPCLEFRRGDCLDLPLADASVDVVVSFETLEHIAGHEEFFIEIRRVLRPGGVFVVSTPDTNVYTLESGFSNPHHLKELTRSEFRVSILDCFRYCSFFEQKALNGSVINTWPGTTPGAFEIFSRSETEKIERHAAIPKPPYVIAVASDEPLRPITAGLYDDVGFVQRFEGSVVKKIIENVFGERGSQDCELIFSSKVSDPIAAGRTLAERVGQSIIITASDDDPRLHISLPKPHRWLLFIADIVAERECNGQVFTRVVGQESVDRRTAQSFAVVPGLNKIRLLLSRDTPVNLVRLDPGDQPGKFVLLRIEVLGASDAYLDTPGAKNKCDASVASSEKQSSPIFSQHICLEHSRMASPSAEYQDPINTPVCIFKSSLL